MLLASCPSCARKVKINLPTVENQRRGGVLTAPFRFNPFGAKTPSEPVLRETATIGQDIDAIFEGLSQEEQDRLREILVPQAKQLAELIRLTKREANETE
jgi:hypothetical protein